MCTSSTDATRTSKRAPEFLGQEEVTKIVEGDGFSNVVEVCKNRFIGSVDKHLRILLRDGDQEVYGEQDGAYRLRMESSSNSSRIWTLRIYGLNNREWGVQMTLMISSDFNNNFQNMFWKNKESR